MKTVDVIYLSKLRVDEIQEVSQVAVLKTVLTAALILISVVITVIILMQEGKSAGLGAIAGASDTYWSKHKDRSMEGMLVKVTRLLVALFLLISIVLNIGSL